MSHAADDRPELDPRKENEPNAYLACSTLAWMSSARTARPESPRKSAVEASPPTTVVDAVLASALTLTDRNRFIAAAFALSFCLRENGARQIRWGYLQPAGSSPTGLWSKTEACQTVAGASERSEGLRYAVPHPQPTPKESQNSGIPPRMPKTQTPLPVGSTALRPPANICQPSGLGSLDEHHAIAERRTSATGTWNPPLEARLGQELESGQR
jgi:hypothetical protein